MRGAEKMKRNVRLIADNPTIVTGRSRRDVEEHSRTKFVDGAIFHRSGGAAGEHHANMFHVTAGGANAWSDMKGPLPSRLVCRPANRHSADVDDFKLPFFKGAHFVRLFEAL